MGGLPVGCGLPRKSRRPSSPGRRLRQLDASPANNRCARRRCNGRAHRRASRQRPLVADSTRYRPARADGRGEEARADAPKHRIAQAGLAAARQSDPKAFFLAEYADRLRVGNFEDNLDWLGEADWIIEAVAEARGTK